MMIKYRSACIEFPFVCDESKMKSGIGIQFSGLLNKSTVRYDDKSRTDNVEKSCFKFFYFLLIIALLITQCNYFVKQKNFVNSCLLYLEF